MFFYCSALKKERKMLTVEGPELFLPYPPKKVKVHELFLHYSCTVGTARILKLFLWKYFQIFQEEQFWHFAFFLYLEFSLRNSWGKSLGTLTFLNTKTFLALNSKKTPCLSLRPNLIVFVVKKKTWFLFVWQEEKIAAVGVHCPEL